MDGGKVHILEVSDDGEKWKVRRKYRSEEETCFGKPVSPETILEEAKWYKDYTLKYKHVRVIIEL